MGEVRFCRGEAQHYAREHSCVEGISFSKEEETRIWDEEGFP